MGVLGQVGYDIASPYLILWHFYIQGSRKNIDYANWLAGAYDTIWAKSRKYNMGQKPKIQYGPKAGNTGGPHIWWAGSKYMVGRPSRPAGGGRWISTFHNVPPPVCRASRRTIYLDPIQYIQYHSNWTDAGNIHSLRNSEESNCVVVVLSRGTTTMARKARWRSQAGGRH